MRIFIIILVAIISWPNQVLATTSNQSLLWEISGNGLKRSSYLYGTMHVSDRVSYHLSDAFFEHLLAADIVAVESHFDEWAALEEILNAPESGWYGFSYSWFRLHPIRRPDILNHFGGITYSTNNILYRTSPQGQDYQEETYLDMFIFQVGQKYGKRTVGLEGAKESYTIMTSLDYSDFEVPTEEKIQELTRLMRDRSPEQALTDFYREKDLDNMLRFMELALPKKWLESMLFERNEIMVKSIDSLVREGSLFASMGAAHLPGKRGAIQMLRDLGYTVTPVHSEYSDAGRAKKTEIDEFFLAPQFSDFKTSDGMVSLPMFNFLLHHGNNTSSPDLTNGGAINLKRSLLNDFLAEKAKRFNHLSIDSLFFENIPGQILSKEFVNQGSIAYYDIKNRTRAGNTQRYRFYITPLELITVSMVGTGQYCELFNDEVFSNVTVNTPSKNWSDFTPNRGGFKISLPDFRLVYGDREDPAHPNDIEIQAFDPSNNSYYFLSEIIAQDLDFVETSFELERIQKEFYIQYDISNYTTIDRQSDRYVSRSKIHDKTIYLKTVADGTKYFLLGCVDCTNAQQKKFFESFEKQPLTPDVEFSTYKDLNHLFSVDVPLKQNENLFLTNKLKEHKNPKEKDTWFKSKSNSYTFSSANATTAQLTVYQYHPYETEKLVDSLFTRLNRRYQSEKDEPEYPEEFDDEELDDFDISSDEGQMIVELLRMMEAQSEVVEDSRFYTTTKAGPVVSKWRDLLNLKEERKYQLVNQKQYFVEEGNYHVHESTARREGTLGEQKRKIVFKDGIRYILTADVTLNYQGDNPFIERFFDSFVPTDTVLEYSVFENKLALLRKHIQNPNDSIRASALNSMRYLNLEISNLNEVKEILEILELDNKDVKYLSVLLEKVAEIDEEQVMEFVTSTYLRDDVNTTLKISLLKGLAKQKSKEVYEKILELLEQYLPIPERRSEIESLFWVFEKNLEFSKYLIPDIFEYFAIEEYKNPILNFCKKLVDSEHFEAENLEPFKQLLFTNANLEFRRVRSWVNNRRSNKESTMGSAALNSAGRLHTYLHLIHPFVAEKRYADLWQNAANLNIPETMLIMLNLGLSNGNLSQELANEMLQRPETKFATMVLLQDKAPDFKLPKVTEMEMAKSAVVLLDHVDLDKQELTFFKNQTQWHNDKAVKFFFYKCKDKEKKPLQAEETTLMSIGFVLDDKGKIIPEAFFSGIQKTIVDDEKMAEYIFEVIDYSLYGHRPRTTHTKDDFTFNPYLGLDF